MAGRTAAAQQKYRDRLKAEKARDNEEVLAILLEDVHVYTREQEDGQQIIGIDMGDDTRLGMELLAANLGKPLRQVVGEALEKVLKQADSLRRLAERDRNKARIEELEARLAEGAAELASLTARRQGQ